MNWRLIFYRNISGQCSVEEFIEGNKKAKALKKDYLERTKGNKNG